MSPSQGLLNRSQREAQMAANLVSNTRDDVADLREAVRSLTEKNEELESEIKLIDKNVICLNSFVRASIDFISDTDHSYEFISKHLDFFYSLLRKQGLSSKQDEETESKEEQGDSIRGGYS